MITLGVIVDPAIRKWRILGESLRFWIRDFPLLELEGRPVLAGRKTTTALETGINLISHDDANTGRVEGIDSHPSPSGGDHPYLANSI